jgi:leucyl-tRNA synthetase
MIDYPGIERKWQKAWDEAHVYEPEPSDREGFLVTFAFPYVNGPIHAGHMKSYSVADSYARYLRMKGYNVLLPTGFHMTGTPILGIAKRLGKNDEELIRDFRLIYKVPEAEIKKMKDPLYLATYFAADTEAGLREAGIGIDWRRKFTSIDPHFSKFVEWQFLRLKEKGLLTQGTHPVGWCPSEQNAVGSHDTKGDVQPKIESVLAVKFKDESSKAYFPCSTYRPETLYGVTNLFLKEDGAYVLAEVGGELYYLAKEAAELLSGQFKVTVKGDAPVNELLSKRVINPLTKEVVPILPGFFVKTDVGTGVVMSVPSHAPFDYIALERLRSQGYPMPKMEYKKLIELEKSEKAGMGKTLSEGEAQAKAGAITHPEIPALAYLELLSMSPDVADSAIEFATKLIYREEALWGVMLVGSYKGRKEPEAREGLRRDLIKGKEAFEMYILSNEEPVICRDGTRVIVKVVDDQWFINYGDQKWKAQVKAALPDIRILPEKMRPTFEYLADWLDLRATERAQGLGTPFPFNPSHIIESLSDSTIYMIFYTFVHTLNANKISPAQLKPEFFDYVINSKGEIDGVAKTTGIDWSIIRKCKESFEYWYKNTSSHSGSDLTTNHLIMYIFNHVAMVDKRYYPKQIVDNGLLMYEGQKMSKSIGNTIPVREVIARYGADPLRFSSIATADLESETNFAKDTVESVKQKNEFLAFSVDQLSGMDSGELEGIDYRLYSRLNSKIAKATKYMDIVEFRSAYKEIYYNSAAELKRYMDLGGCNKVAMKDFLEAVTLMLAPIMPHVAEELWHALGNNTLVVQQRWPDVNESMIDRDSERIDDMIESIVGDIDRTAELTSKIDANKGKRMKEIKVIIADDWKAKAYNMLLERREISGVIKDAAFDGMDKEKVSKFLAPFMGKLQTLQPLPGISADSLYSSFVSARDHLKKRFGIEVAIERESSSKSKRASRAMPDKPSIDVVWG